MRTAPRDLRSEHVVEALAAGWGIHPGSIDCVPEGGGGHHWRAIDGGGAAHFVTVDDLDDKSWLGHDRDVAFDGLRAALETAVALREQAGLGFVVAPLVARDGSALQRLGPRYAVSVFPFHAGRSFPFGPYADAALRDLVVDRVGELHLATPTVRDRAPRHVLGYGSHELAAFVAEPERPWHGGPFSEPARLAFVDHLSEIVGLVHGFDRLADRTDLARRETVITHGEPHPANLLSVDGRLLLVDWDTAGMAVPERDLALLCTEPDGSAARYERVTGHEVDADAVALYQLRWYLDDVASAVRMFGQHHEMDADTELWWAGLAPRLGQLPQWLARLG